MQPFQTFETNASFEVIFLVFDTLYSSTYIFRSDCQLQNLKLCQSCNVKKRTSNYVFFFQMFVTIVHF